MYQIYKDESEEGEDYDHLNLIIFENDEITTISWAYNDIILSYKTFYNKIFDESWLFKLFFLDKENAEMEIYNILKMNYLSPMYKNIDVEKVRDKLLKTKQWNIKNLQ